VDLQLTDKRAIITGASQGIGLATARALAAEGVDLVLAARNAENLETAAKSVATASGRRVIAVPTDVTDDAAVQALVARTVEELGGVDILVNNASNQSIGSGFPGLAGTTDEAFWGDVNTKVVGYLRTSRAVAPHLIAQGWGRIVNVSGLGARQSLSIVRTIRNVSVAALTKNLADELGPQGVNVTVVHPGATRTETTAARFAERAAAEGIDLAAYEKRAANNGIGRVVDAAEVADVIAFLASPRSVSINGDAVAVGGGVLGSVYY
jgi:NAD(P)-dependent dehydrogenase (short-subunit alcohol dehydrogenase family)